MGVKGSPPMLLAATVELAEDMLSKEWLRVTCVRDRVSRMMYELMGENRKESEVLRAEKQTQRLNESRVYNDNDIHVFAVAMAFVYTEYYAETYRLYP
jgi:hypothetical protein